MISLRPALPVAAVLAGAVVALTGCAATSTSDPTDTAQTNSPLHRYLTTLLGSDQTDAERAAADQQVEGVIAACMAKQGFDYVPVDNSDPFYQPDQWRPDDPEWVAQWGYGVVEFPGSDQMHAAQAQGDANTAYYEGLSASEQSAYSDTLYGPAPTDEQLAGSRDGSAPISWEQQGCYGQANHEVRGDDALEKSEYTVLRQAIQTFQETQFAAPEYSDLDAEWADCMADAGFTGLASPDAAKTSIYDALTAYFTSQTTSTTDWNDPQLVALHDKEVDQALADLTCRDKTDFRARSWTIQVAQENRFIADHQQEFDALEADTSPTG